MGGTYSKEVVEWGSKAGNAGVSWWALGKLQDYGFGREQGHPRRKAHNDG